MDANPGFAQKLGLQARKAYQGLLGNKEEVERLQQELRELEQARIRQALEQTRGIETQDPSSAFLQYERIVQDLSRIADKTAEETTYLALAYHGLGRVSESRGKEGNAINHYSQARKLGLAEAIASLATLLAKRSDEDETAIGVYIEYAQLSGQQGNQAVFAVLEKVCRIQEGDQGAKLQQAIQRNKEVIQAVPDMEWAHYYLGLGYWQIGKLEIAISALKQAQDINPKRATTHYYLGRIYLLTGHHEAAKVAWAETLRLNSHQPEVAFQLGQLWLDPLLTNYQKVENATEREELKQAVRWLEQAVRLDAKKETYFYYLGRAQLLQGADSKAASTLQQAINLNGQQKEYFYYQALAHHKLKQENKTKEAVKRAIALDQNYTAAHHLLADLYVEDGSFETAVLHYQAVLRTDIDNVTAKLSLGCCLYEMEKYDQAANTLIPIAARSPKGLFYLGRSQARSGHLDAAITSLQEGINRFGPEANMFYYLGCTYATAGQNGHTEYLKQAIAAFTNCLEQNPSYWQAHLQIGHVCLKLNRLGEARHSYLQAQTFEPHNPVLFYFLGLVAYLEEDLNHSQIALEKAIQHASRHTSTRQKLETAIKPTHTLQNNQHTHALVLLGTIYCKQGHYTKAQDILQQAQTSGEQSDLLLYYLGFSLVQNQQYREAWKVWEQLQTRQPHDPHLTLNITRLAYVLGYEQAKAGQYSNAAYSWERYLLTYTDDEQVSQDLAQAYFLQVKTALQTGTAINQEVKKALQRALQLAGDSEIYQYHLALSELVAQAYDTCIPRLQKLLQAQSTSLEYVYHLALALSQQNRTQEAEPLLQQILAGGEDSELAMKARTILAGLYMREQNWFQAADLFGNLVS